MSSRDFGTLVELDGPGLVAAAETSKPHDIGSWGRELKALTSTAVWSDCCSRWWVCRALLDLAGWASEVASWLKSASLCGRGCAEPSDSMLVYAGNATGNGSLQSQGDQLKPAVSKVLAA